MHLSTLQKELLPLPVIMRLVGQPEETPIPAFETAGRVCAIMVGANPLASKLKRERLPRMREDHGLMGKKVASPIVV